MEKETLTVAETAEFLRVSSWLVYEMVRLKEIPFFRIRTRIFFNRSSLIAWNKSKEAEMIRLGQENHEAAN